MSCRLLFLAVYDNWVVGPLGGLVGFANSLMIRL